MHRNPRVYCGVDIRCVDVWLLLTQMLIINQATLTLMCGYLSQMLINQATPTCVATPVSNVDQSGVLSQTLINQAS